MSRMSRRQQPSIATGWASRATSVTTHTRSSGAIILRFTSSATRESKGVHLFQWVKDIDAYYAEIVGRGMDVAAEPTDQPYGIREFGVRDINGVGIVFGQDIGHD